MKHLALALILTASALTAQNTATATATQVSSYPSEQNDNAGGKQSSRIGNGDIYSMLIRVDLAGLVPTEVCTLYLVQMPANVGTQTFDYAEGEFNTRVATVRGTWNTGAAPAEGPEEGSVCFKYRAYSASAPTLWREGLSNSTVEFESMAAGGSGTHNNSTDVTLNTAASGLPSYAVLDVALIQDLASGACGGLRIKKAIGEDAVEMRFSNTGVSLAWDPTANPIVVERNVQLAEERVYNTPNPFAPLTAIQYPGNDARIFIYDLSGALVRALGGKNGTAVWNGRDMSGREVSCGSYIYRIEFDGKRFVRTMNFAR